jgi:hypothetical protein
MPQTADRRPQTSSNGGTLGTLAMAAGVAAFGNWNWSLRDATTSSSSSAGTQSLITGRALASLDSVGEDPSCPIRRHLPLSRRGPPSLSIFSEMSRARRSPSLL